MFHKILLSSLLFFSSGYADERLVLFEIEQEREQLYLYLEYKVRVLHFKMISLLAYTTNDSFVLLEEIDKLAREKDILQTTLLQLKDKDRYGI